MKILRVIPTIDPETGGPLEGLKRASSIMTEMGIEVHVCTLDAPDRFTKEANTLPWPIHRQGSEQRTYYGYSKRFRRWITNHAVEYDAVIIHGLWQYHDLAAARACRKAKVPYYIFPHGMLDPWFNRTYPLKKVKKQIYWWLNEQAVLRHANAVLFTSEEECRLARQSFRPYQVREHVLGYGTSAPEIAPEEARASLQTSTHEWAQKPYLLFLGRVQEKKGLDLLIQAYSELREQGATLPDLVIAGPEQQPGYAADLKQRFPQEGIHWIGPITGELKSQALAGAEALALVSHQENFGIVVAEALSLGTPVLISNKVNIWREVADNQAGYVAEDSVTGARELLERWLASSAETRKAMAAASLQTFAGHFDIHRSTERLIQLIQSEINNTAK